MDLTIAIQRLTEALQDFEKQEQDPQTQGDSTGAFSVAYWRKVVELLGQGCSIPKNVTPRQLTETPIWLIKKGYVHCCDHSNPAGYQSLQRIDWIDLPQEEIEFRVWVERALEVSKYEQTDHDKVNKIRHECTAYDTWKKNDADYLTAFMRANLTIAERIPALKKAALEQIGHKRKVLESDKAN